MPTIRINQARLYYEESGKGEETIVFAHSLLFSCRNFDEQINALQKRYRCVAFDFRGQGQSAVTATGYDMDSLTEDAAALIQALDCQPCHFVGLSMGGFVGLRLAIRYPELLRSLTLLGSSSEPEPRGNLPKYSLLLFIAQYFGLSPVANRVMPIMFSRSFLKDPKRKVLREKWKAELVANDRTGVVRAVKGVLGRAGLPDEELSRIQTPTLILVGEKDVATIPARSEHMHRQIPGSEMHIIPRAGHISTVEEPEEVNRLLQAFLGTVNSEQ